MKIESEYEKQTQNKIEKNREDFFENVKLSAENLFNDYLKSNFHTKYNKYRNEEMMLKDEELAKSILYSQESSQFESAFESKQSNNNNSSDSFRQDDESYNVNIKFDRKSYDLKKSLHGTLNWTETFSTRR